MILTFSKHKSTPDLTILNLKSKYEESSDKSKAELEFRIHSSIQYIAKTWMRLSVLRDKYMHKVKDPRKWSKLMWDVANWSPIKYSERLYSIMAEIVDRKLSDTEALIKICGYLGIKLDYVNFDYDVSRVTYNNKVCTRRMAKYFPELLEKISRKEYIELKSQNKYFAIKSGNFFYKRKS